jgi:hypothetical protein
MFAAANGELARALPCAPTSAQEYGQELWLDGCAVAVSVPASTASPPATTAADDATSTRVHLAAVPAAAAPALLSAVHLNPSETDPVLRAALAAVPTPVQTKYSLRTEAQRKVHERMHQVLLA